MTTSHLGALILMIACTNEGAVTSDQGADAEADLGFPDRSPDALLYEGFEAGRIDPRLWTLDHTKGIIEISDARAFRGKYSLHIRADPALTDGNTFHSIFETKSFSRATNTFFVRAFVYSPKPLFKGPWSLFWASDGADSWSALDGWYQSTSDGQFLRWTLHPGSHFRQSKTPYQTDRWVCWEWMIAGETNEWRVWIDEQEIPALTIAGAAGWVAPKFRRFHVGVQQRGPEDTPMDTWVDDLVIANQRIGCSR